jgi:LacI family transcriptional regulator
MPVTLKEVAEAAGVSTAAVSKVLHGGTSAVRVGKKRAAEIREIAERLQYTPNALARSLRKSRTQVIGLIFDNFGHIAAGPLYYVYMLDGVASVLFPNKYRLIILPDLRDIDIRSTLSDGQLDGAIWCKFPESGDMLEAVQQSPIPIVALNSPIPGCADCIVSVSCDNEGGTWLAVEHLHALGHREVLFVQEKGEEQTPDSMARVEGFKKAMAALGCPCNASNFVSWSPNADEFAQWWNTDGSHTAIFAWNERMASETLKRAAEAGVDVPRQLSVVGFDSTQYCESTSPRLTAVRQPIQQMAQCAGRLLLSLIDGQSPDHTTFTFPCTFDVRDSTASPHSVPR